MQAARQHLQDGLEREERAGSEERDSEGGDGRKEREVCSRALMLVHAQRR